MFLLLGITSFLESIYLFVTFRIVFFIQAEPESCNTESLIAHAVDVSPPKEVVTAPVAAVSTEQVDARIPFDHVVNSRFPKGTERYNKICFFLNSLFFHNVNTLFHALLNALFQIAYFFAVSFFEMVIFQCLPILSILDLLEVILNGFIFLESDINAYLFPVNLCRFFFCF